MHATEIEIAPKVSLLWVGGLRTKVLNRIKGGRTYGKRITERAMALGLLFEIGEQKLVDWLASDFPPSELGSGILRKTGCLLHPPTFRHPQQEVGFRTSIKLSHALPDASGVFDPSDSVLFPS